MLLPQNVDRFPLGFELVSLPIALSGPDSIPETGRGSPGSIEARISPIDLWDSTAGKMHGPSVSLFELSLPLFWLPGCSITWMFESLTGWESTSKFEVSSEARLFVGDPPSESSPPNAYKFIKCMHMSIKIDKYNDKRQKIKELTHFNLPPLLLNEYNNFTIIETSKTLEYSLENIFVIHLSIRTILAFPTETSLPSKITLSILP